MSVVLLQGKHNDCNKRCGHSPVNTACVELGRHLKSPNTTLNFLAGLDGVLYANTLDGASSTNSIPLNLHLTS